MAIAHLSMRVGTRENGATAAGLAAYVLRQEAYADKAAELVHSESGNMPGWAKDDPCAYWQAADEHERANGSLFREIEFSLPRELTREQQVALATTFCRHLADSRKLPWTMALHDKGDGNPHVHLMLSERRHDGIERGADQWFRRYNAKAPEKGGALKVQDLGARAKWTVTVRAEWEQFANEALEQAGHAERICMASYAAQDIGMTPGAHRGVAGHMAERGIETEREQEQARRRAEQRAQIEANPVCVLDRLTHTQATFSRRGIARELGRHVDEPQAFANLMARIEAHPDLVLLAGKAGERSAIYSTSGMVETEAMMEGHAAAMARRQKHALPVRTASLKSGRWTGDVMRAYWASERLSEEQRAALAHVLAPEQLAVVVGVAGGGKSTVLGPARMAWEAEGYRVLGVALAGKAADGLQAGSGIRSSTIASLEHRLKNGKERLGPRDVLVIDEAGMVGSRQMARVLDAAQKAGAKVMLAGDAEQLQPIEAGAAFRAIAERVGFVEISTVRRQRETWAREASRAFSRDQTAEGLAAYDKHGAVRVAANRDAARAAIAAAYMQHDGPNGPSRIILAHSNRDVEALNQAVREARRAVGGGRLGIDDVAFPTARGVRQFAVNDRVVFLKNDRKLGVKNGTLGTVVAAGPGRLGVRLDGSGRDVIVDATQYDQLDHGYAVTLHKAQGVTVDRAYVLATPGMDRHLAYVGMTRHREEAQLYYGRDDFERTEDLYRTLSRSRPATTTLDFAERRGIETRRGWLEAGRDALANLGRRFEACVGKVRELVALRDQWGPRVLATHLAEVEQARRDQEEARRTGKTVPEIREARYTKAVSDRMDEQRATASGPRDRQSAEAPAGKPNGRLYLAVPFAEKDQAKAAGARWDNKARAWWIGAGENTGPFRQWLDPKRAETVRNPKLRREIAQAQEAARRAAEPHAAAQVARAQDAQEADRPAVEPRGRPPETPEEAKLRRWQTMSAAELGKEIERLQPVEVWTRPGMAQSLQGRREAEKQAEAARAGLAEDERKLERLREVAAAWRSEHPVKNLLHQNRVRTDPQYSDWQQQAETLIERIETGKKESEAANGARDEAVRAYEVLAERRQAEREAELKAVGPDLRSLETLLAAEQEIERGLAEMHLMPEDTEEIEPEITPELDLDRDIDMDF